MKHNPYLYIFVMAAVTYAIRVLPLTLIRKEIKNRTIRSFLYYVPYVTLAVMTFPAIVESTGSVWSGWAALLVGAALAWFGKSLFVVSVAACASVFLLELLLLYSSLIQTPGRTDRAFLSAQHCRRRRLGGTGHGP